MAVETNLSAIARQMSGTNPAGDYILSVLTKRTYYIGPSGRCVPADEQLPLTVEVQPDPDNPDLLAADTDLFPYKPLTDIVIHGNARTVPARGAFEVAIEVANSTKSLLAQGDRKCAISPVGSIRFSDPQRVEEVPLRYDKAYGGKDIFAEARYGNPYEAVKPYLSNIDVAKASPYIYPRNPAGVGYVIETSAEALEQLQLPNLEDSEDLLSPVRLSVGKTGRWPLMPLPQSVGWVDYGWFPRLGYFGFVHAHDPLEQPVVEVIRGWAVANILENQPLQDKFSFRMTNGASLGLQLPYLAGDEQCQLTKIHRLRSSFTFSLPGERPRIWTDGRNGKLNATEPVIHTVVIEPDQDRVTILWCGSAPALRPYMAEELATMPFRVEWD